AIDWERQRSALKQPHAGPRASFDREAYARDPASYLHDLDWSRQDDVAQEGPAVRPLLRPDGTAGVAMKIAPRVRVPLTVQADPGWPVSFSSPDRGVFDNGLPVITGQADAK